MHDSEKAHKNTPHRDDPGGVFLFLVLLLLGKWQETAFSHSLRYRYGHIRVPYRVRVKCHLKNA